VDYWVLFWHDSGGDPSGGGPVDGGSPSTGPTRAEIAAELRAGRWQCVPPAAGVAELRRDVVASDPDWPAMTLHPRPGSGVPTDRYLGLVFGEVPSADELRDLRYVAARNRLTMFDPQRPDEPEVAAAG
jgi:hypothetical protein